MYSVNLPSFKGSRFYISTLTFNGKEDNLGLIINKMKSYHIKELFSGLKTESLILPDNSPLDKDKLIGVSFDLDYLKKKLMNIIGSSDNASYDALCYHTERYTDLLVLICFNPKSQVKSENDNPSRESDYKILVGSGHTKHNGTSFRLLLIFEGSLDALTYKNLKDIKLTLINDQREMELSKFKMFDLRDSTSYPIALSLVRTSFKPQENTIMTHDINVEEILLGSQLVFKNNKEYYQFYNIVPYYFDNPIFIYDLPHNIYTSTGALVTSLEFDFENSNLLKALLHEIKSNPILYVKTLLNPIMQKYIHGALRNINYVIVEGNYFSSQRNDRSNRDKYNKSNRDITVWYSRFILGDAWSKWGLLHFLNEATGLNNVEMIKEKYIEIIRDSLQKRGLQLPNDFEKYVDVDSNAKFFALSALMLGVHGISHLIIKSLQATLGANNVGESIIIETNRDLIPILPKSSKLFSLDGLFQFKVNEENNNKVLFSIYNYVLNTKINVPDISDRVKTQIKNILYRSNNRDRCEYNWMEERNRLSIVKSFIEGKDRKVVEVEKEIQSKLDREGVFYPPRDLFRIGPLRYIMRSKNVEHDKRVVNFVQDIWPYYVPQCSDGCYSCVLIARGCNLIPIKQELMISKHMAKFLLKNILKFDLP